MKAGLDTSVLLRLIMGEPENLAQIAWQEIRSIMSGDGRIYISDLVLSEAYFAPQHHYGVPKKVALEKLNHISKRHEFILSASATEVLAVDGLEHAKPGFMDRLIHAQYAKSIDVMVTFEKSAKKLPQVRVLAS